jgi:predicted Rossmann fold flavoprotein
MRPLPVVPGARSGYGGGMDPERVDVVILGAGGAGLMCAIAAGRRGRRVVVLDHAAKPGGKILLSGGGRCNFTNREVTARNFVSANPHFATSALSRYRPEDFVALVEKHGIPYHERKHGQLFCDRSARDLLDMLVRECAEAGVELRLAQTIGTVDRTGDVFRVETPTSAVAATSLVVATGGLSIPKFGATGLGYDIATRFGLALVPRAPALDGFVFSEADRARLDGFAGIALDAEMRTNGVTFRENLLFTHLGLSGPVALQASLHWNPGDEVRIDFVPGSTPEELAATLLGKRGTHLELRNRLAALAPRRLAERLCELSLPATFDIGNLPRTAVATFLDHLKAWTFVPAATVGYHKAEVTRGGVDTQELSSKTMEARKVPGLYFIGEVVDVTGWLGGFNYQWAWASGMAAGAVV